MNIDPIEQAVGIAEAQASVKMEEKPLAQFQSMVTEFNKNNPGKRVTVGKLEEVFATGVRVFGEQNLRGNENAFAMSFVTRFLNAYAKKQIKTNR
jgi:hypothetical protein